jgi:hypothetical protein
MDYSVGSRIQVRLYSGKVVETKITAITNQSAGRKVQIVYGNVTASIIRSSRCTSKTAGVLTKSLSVKAASSSFVVTRRCRSGPMKSQQ